MIARLALQAAVEEAEGFNALISRTATSRAADAVCRAVLESSSLAWWLLDPDVGAQARLARALAYRLHTAKETRGPSVTSGSGQMRMERQAGIGTGNA